MLMVIILMIATLLTGVVIHLTIQEIVTGNVGGMGATVGAYEFLSEINQKLLVRVFAVLFVTVLIAIMAGVFFLHRVAGPIYRIRVTLRQLADSKVPARNVKLRHGDFFQEVAVELNHVIENMRKDHPERIVHKEKKEETTPETSS